MPICKEAGLWESVHALLYIDVDATVFHKWVYIVLLDDLFGDEINGKPHALLAPHGGIKLEVFNIRAHEARTRRGDSAVEDHLGCGYVGFRCADITWLLDEVAPNRVVCTASFILMGKNSHNNSPVGHYSSLG